MLSARRRAAASAAAWRAASSSARRALSALGRRSGNGRRSGLRRRLLVACTERRRRDSSAIEQRGERTSASSCRDLRSDAHEVVFGMNGARCLLRCPRVAATMPPSDDPATSCSWRKRPDSVSSTHSCRTASARRCEHEMPAVGRPRRLLVLALARQQLRACRPTRESSGSESGR